MIVIDGGSSDKTPCSTVRRFEDARLADHSQSDQGVADGLNKRFAMRGTILGWLQCRRCLCQRQAINLAARAMLSSGRRRDRASACSIVMAGSAAPLT